MKIESTKNTGVANLKVLVHGPAGSQKTRMCATTGGTPLILSVEAGLLSLRQFDLAKIEIKTFKDLKDVHAGLAANAAEFAPFDWICLDSISEIAEVTLSEKKATEKDGRMAYGEMNEAMIKLIRDFRDLPRNLYVSAKQERIKDEMTGGMYYGPSTPGKTVGPALPYLFDEVFALRSFADDKGVMHPWFQTFKDNQYEAKDRSGALLPYEYGDLSLVRNKIVNS